MQGFGKKSPAEKQADKFAVRLLCPACVLMAIEACEASEIAKVCKVPLPIAEKRAERMKELLVRNKFFTNPLEKQVFDNFKSYIEQTGSDKG